MESLGSKEDDISYQVQVELKSAPTVALLWEPWRIAYYMLTVIIQIKYNNELQINFDAFSQ